MGEKQEKPFYVMMFFSLLAAGGVFVFASMVTMDRVRLLTAPRRVKFVFHQAIASAFGNFCAATDGSGFVRGKLRALAADFGSYIAKVPADHGKRPDPGRAPGGSDRPGGINANLFDTATGLVAPRFRPVGYSGRTTTATSDYYDPGDIPGPTLPGLPRKDRRGQAPVPRSPLAPPAPDGVQPARPDADRPGTKPLKTAAGQDTGPDRHTWERTENAAAPAAPKWDAGSAGARTGADPDRGDFNLQGIKAGAIKNSAPAGGGTEPKAAKAAGQGAGGAYAPDPGKVGGVLNQLAAKINPAGTGGATPKPAAAPHASTQTRPSPDSPQAADAPTESPAEEDDLTPEEAQQVNDLILKALESIERGYGPMAALFYTDCADSPLCGEHGLKGGFLTMTTETGALVKISAKKTDSKWETYTIDFQPPPQTGPEN